MQSCHTRGRLKEKKSWVRVAPCLVAQQVYSLFLLNMGWFEVFPTGFTARGTCSRCETRKVKIPQENKKQKIFVVLGLSQGWVICTFSFINLQSLQIKGILIGPHHFVQDDKKVCQILSGSKMVHVMIPRIHNSNHSQQMIPRM